MPDYRRWKYPRSKKDNQKIKRHFGYSFHQPSGISDVNITTYMFAAVHPVAMYRGLERILSGVFNFEIKHRMDNT